MEDSHSIPLPLQERLPQNNNPKRAIELIILLLLLLLLSHRLSLISVHGAPWLLAALCESWFTFIWALTVNAKWNPAVYRTFPENISKRFKELPHLDVFVTTADASLEPPIITVDTVLSVLAVDYPPERLACYVSDDGCSAATYRALVEASGFARLWVPFCKRHGVRTRAPSVCFSEAEIGSDGGGSPEFLDEWRMMKKEYEELRQRIEQKINDVTSFECEEDAKDFSGIEVRNHPSIIKVIWENKEAGQDGIPHLIYVAREKSPNHSYHYKAGAMNVLTRVSAVMTNAPFMLNLDCDMFANNSKIMLHAMCLMLGFDDEVQSGFVQCPQQFHGALKDDPFGNQLVVLQQYIISGIAGIQGPPYGGTGCFHRRKVIYGVSPGHGDSGKENEKIKKETFGHSRELMGSATQIIKGTTKKEVGIYDLSSSLEAAKIVARSDYEFDTSWGKEVGWLYGSTVEDINTGVRIHANGWGSVRCTPEHPAFLGNAPVGGPESMTQLKRWATGLFEIIVGHNSPLIAVVTKKLRLRQCLAYMVINLWAARSLPEFCYALLPASCVLSDVAF